VGVVSGLTLDDVPRHRGIVMEHHCEVYREREGWVFDSQG
jgi:hypothetical protein